MEPLRLTFPIRGDKVSMQVEATAQVHRRVTPFQTIDIYDTEALGRILLLDGHIQLSTLDERAYHEALIHIPLLSIPKPRRALVVGGGDGGALRELAKHASLQAIDMVEIDVGVVEASRDHLPMLSGGAFEDPRVRLLVQDAFPFVKAVAEPYDLIVLDVTDVYEEEDGALSERIFTRGFYQDCLKALTADGMVVTQADNPVFCPYSLEGILSEFRQVFPRVGSYQAAVPSFGGYSAFAWASRGNEPANTLPPCEGINLTYLNPATYAFAIGRLAF